MQNPITVRCLTKAEKDLIVQQYQNKASLKSLAFLFEVSTRTIGRVLEERDLLTPVPRIKGEAYKMMRLLKLAGISDAEELKELLLPPVLDPAIVQIYLNDCSKEKLATHFYTSGLVKLAEITQQTHATRKQQQAALFCPPQQTSFTGFAA